MNDRAERSGMTFREYKYLVLSDLYRITGRADANTLVRYLLIGGVYKYTFWLRTCQYTRKGGLKKLLAYPFARLILHRLMYKYGVAIGIQTDFDSGFYIGHFGGIVVNGRCKIGKNCNISQGVTLGQTNRGKYAGCPTLGDNVYIGPGAKVIGAVKIGNNVAIGANCVVTKDVPDNAVVVGVPGRVISQEGSAGYVNNIDYDEKLGGRA